MKFGIQDVRKKEKKLVYDGHFKMYQYFCEHRLYQGDWSERVTREVFERGDAVVVLPYDPVRDRVVLIEQFRAPLIYKDEQPWLIELVAGMIEEGESPMEVAHRELEEETGLTSQDITPIHSYFSSPGGSTEKVYLYLAKVDSSQAKGVHGLVEEHEDIQVFTASMDEVQALMTQGKMKNAMSLVGLQWLMLNREHIQHEFKG